MIFKSIVLFKKNFFRLLEDNAEIKLGNDKILVRILYSGVCRSQLMEIDMKRGKDKYLPHMLGHEAVGIVEDIGTKIKKVSKGDKVVLSWIKGSGISSQGGKIFLNNKKINFGPVSTFSNKAIVSEDRCFKVAKDFPSDIGVFFGCSVLTGAGMVFNHCKIKKDNSVLVLGLGGIGLSVLLALKSQKIKNVTVLESNNHKFKLIKKIGYSQIVKPTDPKIFKKIKKYSNNKLFDYCIESAGKVETIELGLSLINNDGTLIFASHPESNKKISVNPHELIKGKKIIGSWGGNTKPDIDIVKYYNIFKKNNLLKFLSGKIYTIENFHKAIKDFRAGKVLRPILKF
jgi:S-(hydroxymethyl)glutathione dehydrogenase/alcohol dehydrogenase